MMDKPLVIPLTPEDQDQLEQRSAAQGLSPAEYVLALIHADTKNDEAVDIRAEFIEAWKEARKGNGIPVAEMWALLEDD
jgi:hypothetical protein